MTEIAHPREVFELHGHGAAEEAFEVSRVRGRLHHAWLLIGTEGLGKSTFAYRAARRLLGAAADPGYGVLGADPAHPVSRQVAARAHPDLLVLDRVGEDGKPRKVIPVDEVRRLGEFFSKSPASAPHRVAIVDAADDLNINAANALLKTLEEPPPRGVLLLVSHAPGRLLATIRSRCRRLDFSPMPLAEAAAFLRARTELDEATALRFSEMAGGAPGRALALAAADALGLDEAAQAILAELPRLDQSLALTLADRFRGGGGAVQFNLLFERLAERVHAQTVRGAAQGTGGLDRWAEAWETLQRLPREVEALNLDRADALFTALNELRQAAQA